MMRVPMVSSQSLHGEYVKYGGLVRSSAGAGPDGRRLVARAPGRNRSCLGLKGFPRKRRPVLGSPLPIRFLQRALHLGADPSDYVHIISAQLVESTRSHRPARRRSWSPVE